MPTTSTKPTKCNKLSNQTTSCPIKKKGKIGSPHFKVLRYKLLGYFIILSSLQN